MSNRIFQLIILTFTLTVFAITQDERTEYHIDGYVYLEGSEDHEGVEISFMILENSSNSHRINFRSSGNYSVNDVAQVFDGGGHKFAAGAKVNNLS